MGVTLGMCLLCIYSSSLDRIDGVMVSILDSSAVDREFENQSDQIKDFKIGICCFSTSVTCSLDVAEILLIWR